jgi:phage terminase large subunit GpA-like protein
MLNQETAKAARTDSGYILRAPRRMRVADAVAQYMRVWLTAVCRLSPGIISA